MTGTTCPHRRYRDAGTHWECIECGCQLAKGEPETVHVTDWATVATTPDALLGVPAGDMDGSVGIFDTRDTKGKTMTSEERDYRARACDIIDSEDLGEAEERIRSRGAAPEEPDYDGPAAAAIDAADRPGAIRTDPVIARARDGERAEREVTPHEEHVRKHHRSLIRMGPEALKPRTCEGCGKPICCMYGQKAVTETSAPSGVWLLHPECAAPRNTETR
jgi:hypothetical protein